MNDQGILWTDDVEAILGRKLTDAEETAVEDVLIPFHSAELESILNRPILPVAFTDEPVSVVNSKAIFRHTPVISIASLSDGSTAYVVGSYDPKPWGAEGSWSDGTVLTATYTAGLAGYALDACRSIILKRVARAVIRMADDAIGATTITVEGYSATYAEEDFTDKELKAVERWRKRVVR